MTYNEAVEKVQKLFDLAKGTSFDEEANAAILKAHAIMAKHNISESSIHEDKEISYSEARCSHTANRLFRRPLGQIIARNFRCRMYLDVSNNLCFWGRSEDVVIAKEVFEFAYHFAYRKGNRLVKDAKSKRLSTTDIHRAYTIGFLHGLKTNLDTQSLALAVIVPPDVVEGYKEFSKNFSKTKYSLQTGKLTQQAFNAQQQGVIDGESIMDIKSKNQLAPA